MGMNLKEKFQNLNKKNIAIIVSILFVIAICSVCGYEYFQMKKFQATVMAPSEEEPNLAEQTPVQEETEPTKKPSEYNVGMDYDKAMAAKKPVIVLFYADWCHYCIKFMPTYQKLAENYKKDFNFAKVNVEDPKHEKLVRSIGITGFPTVFIIDPKYDNRVLLSNAIFGDMNKLQAELDRFARIRKLLDAKK